MAHFTMQLRDIIKLTDGKIGLDSYPIFDESYREQLNTKIIEHYFMQEIGVETVDLFRFYMRRTMNEVMPYYNQLYKSELLVIDPFLTFESVGTTSAIAEQSGGSESSSTASSDSDSDSTSRTVASETPQTRLAGAEDYATAAQDAASRTSAGSVGEDQSSTAQTSHSAQDGETSSRGFSGSMAELLIGYRQTFLNIDMMVIEDLRPLFMQIWATGEAFTY